jgi:hypothetical protein
VKVSFEHPANAGVLHHLGRSWHLQPGGQPRQDGDLPSGGSAARIAASAAPEDVRDPYYTLGSHPDLVERLWDDLGGRLPERCRWVVYGQPTLVHPRSGIVFGFTAGTHTYALRLPEAEHGLALRRGAAVVHTYGDGSQLDLARIGDAWILGRWFPEEPAWCLAAYDHAGRL